MSFPTQYALKTMVYGKVKDIDSTEDGFLAITWQRQYQMGCRNKVWIEIELYNDDGSLARSIPI